MSIARRDSDSLRSPPVVLGVLRVVDALVVLIAALAAYWLRHGHFDAPFSYVVVTVVGVVLVANGLHFGRLYVFELLMEPAEQVHRLAIVMPLVFLTMLALGFFTKTSADFSRVWMVMWFGLDFAGLVVARIVLLIHLRSWQRRGWLTRNLVVVGAGEPGERLVRHLAANSDPAVRLLGLFDDRATRVPSAIEGYQVLGRMADIDEFVRDQRVDEIVIALPLVSKQRLVECLNQLRTLPLSVRLCPDTLGLQLPNRGFSHIGEVPMINVFDPPLSGWSVLVKAIEDRVLAALIVLAILPTLATIAVLIKLDSPGPALFRQRRYGFNNEIITVYKFRSMVSDPAYADGARQAVRDDSRVTPLGAFLRRYSLDELPQFFNVLRGEMSIVGPRPHAVPHNEQYAALIHDYLARHKVKPGITGWAQVNGLRGETESVDKMEARVQYDLYYVDNWSLWFDLRIILLTALLAFRPHNAY